jgi:hypothetical protein
MSDEDQDLLRYGPCEHCGGPRTVKVTEHPDGISLVYELGCPTCDQEGQERRKASDLEPWERYAGERFGLPDPWA